MPLACFQDALRPVSCIHWPTVHCKRQCHERLVRHSLNFCGWKDRNAVVKSLKRIYQATDDVEAEWGQKYGLQNPRRCDLSKGGLEAGGIGRSRSGLRTEFPAAMDALGLPICFAIAPGQWGARGLIKGLSAVQHVRMDAACEADHLRRFFAEDPGAAAHLKRNPTRREDRPIDRARSKERQLVACFFNRIKRFRRIALPCEKTVSSFKVCVDLACVMGWIS